MWDPNKISVSSLVPLPLRHVTDRPSHRPSLRLCLWAGSSLCTVELWTSELTVHESQEEEESEEAMENG